MFLKNIILQMTTAFILRSYIAISQFIANTSGFMSHSKHSLKKEKGIGEMPVKGGLRKAHS